MRGFAQVGKLEGHHVGFLGEIGKQGIERRAAEVKAGFERLLDANVEPALDRAGDELHRHGIDQRAGQHGDDAKHQHQAQLEAGTEDLRPVIAPQRAQLPADERDHGQRQDDVKGDQQRIVPREDAGVGRRRHQQQEPGNDPERAGNGAADGDKTLHLASTGMVTCQVFQSEARLQSRLPSALIWNGRGNWLMSRRRRKAAT